MLESGCAELPEGPPQNGSSPPTSVHSSGGPSRGGTGAPGSYVGSTGNPVAISPNGKVPIGDSDGNIRTPYSGNANGFPDSPPHPTTFTTVPNSLLRVGRSTTLGDLGDQLGDALESSGFSRTFLHFRDGFAVVACIEQIDATGHSLPPPNRFSMDVAPMQSFNIAEYFSRLLAAHPGHFRLFVITVSSESFYFGPGSLSATEAKGYIGNGSASLVGPIRDVPVPRDVACVALVYEFYRASESNEAELSTSPIVSAREHLRLAGIWDKL